MKKVMKKVMKKAIEEIQLILEIKRRLASLSYSLAIFAILVNGSCPILKLNSL